MNYNGIINKNNKSKTHEQCHVLLHSRNIQRFSSTTLEMKCPSGRLTFPACQVCYTWLNGFRYCFPANFNLPGSRKLVNDTWSLRIAATHVGPVTLISFGISSSASPPDDETASSWGCTPNSAINYGGLVHMCSSLRQKTMFVGKFRIIYVWKKPGTAHNVSTCITRLTINPRTLSFHTTFYDANVFKHPQLARPIPSLAF